MEFRTGEAKNGSIEKLQDEKNIKRETTPPHIALNRLIRPGYCLDI